MTTALNVPPPARVVEGASRTEYELDETGLEGLRRDYDALIVRYGGLGPALYSIAAMLDVRWPGLPETASPDVVVLLLAAAEALAHPERPSAVTYLEPTMTAAVPSERPAPLSVREFLGVEGIAVICHEANRALCERQGDTSQVQWHLAPEWQKQSARDGVAGILEGRIEGPLDAHASWMAQKLREGWTFGPVKDPEKRTHPCLVPYAELPASQRVKDRVFFALVTAIARTV